MIKAFLIDDFFSFNELIKNKYLDINEDIILTTSEGLIEKILEFESRIKIINPEKYLSSELLARLDQININLTKFTAGTLAKLKFKSINKLNLEIIYINQIYRTLFPLVYKTTIIDYCNKKYDLYVVGSKSDLNTGINLSFGRFDNLYYDIALYEKNYKIKKIKINNENSIKDKLDKEIEKKSFTFIEKLLSITSNNLNLFSFKIYRNFKINKLTNILFKKKIIILNSCETLENAFFNLIKNKYSIHFDNLNFLNNIKISDDDQYVFLESNLKFLMTNLNLYINKNFSDLHFSNYNSLIYIFSKKILHSLNLIDHNYNYISRSISKKLEYFSSKILLTNYLDSVSERFYGIMLMKKNVSVYSFEHGLIHGLSEISKDLGNINGMIVSNFGFYNWKYSTRDLKLDLNKKHKVFKISFPSIYFRKNNNLLKKLILKKYFKIGLTNKTLIFLIDVDKNNWITPYSLNDYLMKRVTEDIYKDLKSKYPDYTILIKLYPATRYLDKLKFNNLKLLDSLVIDDFDLRYILDMADVIALYSSQSVLTWLLGSNKKIILYETNRNLYNFTKLNKIKIKDNINLIENLDRLKKDFVSEKFDLSGFIK